MRSIHKAISPFFFILPLLIISVSVTPSTPNSEIAQMIDALIAKMTPEEKLGQLNQLSGDMNQISAEQTELVRKGLVGSFLNVVGAEVTREIQRIAVEESRLGIPLMFAFDVIHGYRTIFPMPLAEASSWDPALAEQTSHVAAIEASAAGLHWTFAPMVDIARDPRWGRIVEGSGEDPYLGSMLAAARVKGFQGKNLKEEGSVMACAKHFAAYGGAEGGRDYNTVDISARTLREIYLPPFQAAVNAGVGSLMSAFTEIGGIPSTANHELLTSFLRNEWGFRGLVVSDWSSIAELQQHGIAVTRAEAGKLAINAGVDVDMESRIYFPELVHEKIPQSQIDNAVRNVLRAKFQLGLFDDPFRNCNRAREKRMILHPDHRALARKAAQRSIVLLKNDRDLLPLKKAIRTIAIVGPLAENKMDLLGSWKAVDEEADAISVAEGIRYKVPDVKVISAKGCEFEAACGSLLAEAERLAAKADMTIVVVGESASMSGEASSRANIGLPGHQEELVRAISAAGKPFVVVLMNGRPLAIPWIAENAPAILETWFLGMEAGNAIADVLFGDVNPTGKLPVTFPRMTGQIPIYYNHKNTGRPASAERWTSKYLDVADTPLYPFGFGLSYTTFVYDHLQLSSDRLSKEQTLTIRVDVKNTGKRSGEEVVQLYVRDLVGSVTRPVKELKGFQRISLSAGEKKTVEFSLNPEQLAFYNIEMNQVVESGTFLILVGPNSQDGLKVQFELVQ